MPNARDDKDRVHNNRKRRDASPIFAPVEEIGEMHFSTENYSTAIEYFQKALESPELNDYPDRYRVLLRIADCLERKGGHRDARDALSRARATLSEETPDIALGRVEFREASILQSQGNYDDALKLGFSAYRKLKHSSEHKEVADIQKLLANCYHRLGQTGEAEEFYMDALSSYRRVEDKKGIAIVYNNLGLVHKNACRWQRALSSLNKSLELAESLGLTQQQIWVHNNLGVVYAKLRRYSDAIASFGKAETMAERFGDQYALTNSLFMKGRTFIHTGEYAKAEKYILRAQVIANDNRYRRESALTDEFLGELMIARGRPEEALQNLKKGLTAARMIAPEGDVVAEILRRISDVHYTLNNIDKSLALIEEGLEIATRCGELYEIGYFHRTRALCLKRRHEFEGAAESLQLSVDTFTEYGNEYEKGVSKQLLARLYLRDKSKPNLVKAKQILADSIVGFGKLDETDNQILSQVLMAVVEENLGNLDEALLAVYEADRLADDDHPKHRKLLTTLRERVEGKMAHDTNRVLEQIPMFGDIQSASRSRDKLVTGLTASLKLIMGKLNAQAGFVAIPKADSKTFEVVTREGITLKTSRALMSWRTERDEASELGLLITETERDAQLGDVKLEPCTLVSQELGFEDESLGYVFIYQAKKDQANPIGQEALHFLGAYSRLISLSVYELLRNEKRSGYKAKPTGTGFESIVTENQDMLQLLNLAERVAHSNATVLLQGETGTGKTLIAYAVHLLSECREKRFVHINCAAMPESLLESELFGHARGAFTGAVTEKEGLLAQANGGTIFLDEIGKTSLSMQGKLLQFLDTGKVRKVGSNELVPVNVRLVCASKADLMELCHEGRFLEDFFYRINDFPLTVPPLRKRPEDIPLLFFHYLRKFSREMDKGIVDIDDEAMDMLKGHFWAGNVRELEKIVKRAVILAEDGDTLTPAHLPVEITSNNGESAATEGSQLSLRAQIHRLEKREILSSLERNDWNKTRAAIELDISYPSLLSKIKRYSLRKY